MGLLDGKTRRSVGSSRHLVPDYTICSSPYTKQSRDHVVFIQDRYCVLTTLLPAAGKINYRRRWTPTALRTVNCMSTSQANPNFVFGMTCKAPPLPSIDALLLLGFCTDKVPV